MKHKVGIRVGALQSTDRTTAYLFGFGVYEGDFDPDDKPSNELGEIAKEEGWKNPRIKLDSGKIVWGYESWWGPEEKIRAQIEGLVVVDVDIDAVRRQALAELVEAEREANE